MTNARLRDQINEVADVIATAGGEIVGKTRLQKTVFLLSCMGLSGTDFRFQYKHYGPFSEALATAADVARFFGEIEEVSQPSTWGGVYSIFRTRERRDPRPSDARAEVIIIAKGANAIDLELAATAAFLASEGHEDAWEETAARKPDKQARIPSAKELYRKLLAVDAPHLLPRIV